MTTDAQREYQRKWYAANRPISSQYRTDLYLPTGEISDTQIWMMASDAADDGRPLVVLYFSDCDPAGWQMPISVSRKLQAFRAMGYDFEFETHRVALRPDHVREYGLPSTPLKDTERRADRWQAAMGVEQTEIDALAATQPDVLAGMARDAVAPFFDNTLTRRVRVVEEQWEADAQQAMDAQSDADLGPLREQAAERLAEKQAEIAEILNSVHVDADMFDLPDVPEVPQPVIDYDSQPEPLCDSRWDFAEQCRRLIRSKNYTNGEVTG